MPLFRQYCTSDNSKTYKFLQTSGYNLAPIHVDRDVSWMAAFECIHFSLSLTRYLYLSPFTYIFISIYFTFLLIIQRNPRIKNYNYLYKYYLYPSY